MPNKTILSCAVIGSHTMREHNPDIPITPGEIANSCIEASQEGAAIVHIHVRDPIDGKASMELDLYREVVERIRNSKSDVLINLTTGPGGRFDPSEYDPSISGANTNLKTAEQRVEHVVALRPEICSLDLNTMWFGQTAVVNAPASIRKMAQLITESGVKPELEVFDTGDIALARDLLEEGVLPRSPLFQIVTGVKYGAIATSQTLAYMKSLLPQNCTWAAFGVGRWAYPMLVQSWLLGGHCRIGLEDTAYLARGQLAPDNASLVRKAKMLIEELGGSVASPSEAREILEIPEMV